nr:hypothetical protein BaRGS_020663 [Batillaria attramentaria]
MNRSEFDDGLLRNNQRFDNRLQQEIQAVEKAQRIIAKGLDKESQFFRQRASVSSMTPTNTPRGAVKKNSFSEFGSYSGNEFPSNTRLIPDYQYQGSCTSHTTDYDNRQRACIWCHYNRAIVIHAGTGFELGRSETVHTIHDALHAAGEGAQYSLIAFHTGHGYIE